MTNLLRKVFPQMINLAVVAMLGVLAIVLALSSYPFAEHDTLILTGWLVVLAVVVVSMTAFVGMNRDRIVSMLKGTEPGQFSWDSTFTLQLLLYAVLPILTLLGAQFPHVFTGVFSWIGGHFSGAR